MKHGLFRDTDKTQVAELLMIRNNNYSSKDFEDQHFGFVPTAVAVHGRGSG